MKAKVYVTLKAGILDPQGKAIQHSLEGSGFTSVAEVRQGKYFEISFLESVSESEVIEAVEKIAKDVLANPVIEDYRVEVVEA